MYALLAPIRYVLNLRFNLNSPIQSALFYIAPGCGYLIGAAIGGRWADYTTKRMIKERGGQRIPEGRLRACMVPLSVITPGCVLIYGWSVDKAVGGVAVTVLAMFFQGVSQLCTLPALNTYCLDVMLERSAEVLAMNYMMRYFFAAMVTATSYQGSRRLGWVGFRPPRVGSSWFRPRW
jgi:hypothetical protein